MVQDELSLVAPMRQAAVAGHPRGADLLLAAADLEIACDRSRPSWTAKGMLDSWARAARLWGECTKNSSGTSPVLCVGGPYDGVLVYLEPAKMEFQVTMPGHNPAGMIYRRFWFGISSVLAPEGWETSQIVARMASVYRAAFSLHETIDRAK